MQIIEKCRVSPKKTSYNDWQLKKVIKRQARRLAIQIFVEITRQKIVMLMPNDMTTPEVCSHILDP